MKTKQNSQENTAYSTKHFIKNVSNSREPVIKEPVQTTQIQIRYCTQIPWETTQKKPKPNKQNFFETVEKDQSGIKWKYAETNWSALHIKII